MKILQLESDRFPLPLEEGWRIAYEENFRYKYPEKFEWLHVLNPYCKETSTGIYYLVVDEEIATWSTVIKHEVKIGPQIFKGGFGADTHTLVKFRRKGLGTKILEKLIEVTDVYWAITMTPANRRNRMKAGCMEGLPLDHYFKVIGSLNKASYIKSITKQDQIKNRFISSLVGSKIISIPVFHFVNCILKQKKTAESIHEFMFDKIEKFDDLTERLWQEESSKYDFTTNRDSTYLNWRYTEHPQVEYEKYKIRHKTKTVGFFVFRFGTDYQRSEVYITELFVQAGFENAIPEVLNFIENSARERKVDILYVSSSLVSVKERIEDSGFNFYRSEIAVFTIKPHIKQKIDLDSILSDKAVWFMSRGDQELDILNNDVSQPGALVLVKTSLRLLLRKLKFWPGSWSHYRIQGSQTHLGS